MWDDCADNIGFVQLFGDKAATDAAFAKADHVVKHRFVINRVTAATMEPRGCIGDYNPTDGRYTIYTTLQRAHPYRAELAPILKVPESKIRVVAGDIGGSFGMKSAVYNEVALVLLASKLIGRPVKWTCTRSEAFLCDAQARDNVTEAELALDKDGNFLGMRVKTVASIGAYLQTGMPAFTGNIGTLAGVYRTPAIARRRHRGVHPHQSGAALSRQRPPGGGLCDRAAGRSRRRRARHRSGRAAAAQLHPARRDAVQDRRSPSPTTAASSRRAWTWRSSSPTSRASRSAAARRASAASCAGIGISNTIERAAAQGFEGAEIRFDKSGAVTLFSGSVTQGQGHETIYKQIVCDRLGIDPDEVHYIQGDTDQVFLGEGTGGSRSATHRRLGVSTLAADKIITKAQADRRPRCSRSMPPTSISPTASSPARRPTARSPSRRSPRIALDPAKLPKDMEAGLIATATYTAPVQNFPNGCHICELEIDQDTGEVEIVRYSVVDDVGTVLNPLLLKGQIVGGVAQGVGQILMEDIRFDDDGQLLTGSFMDYAMPRATDISAVEVKSNPVPTATNPLGVKGAGEAGCVGAMPAVANALVDALSHLGVRHVEMPATPERLWRAIQNGNCEPSACPGRAR